MRQISCSTILMELVLKVLRHDSFHRVQHAGCHNTILLIALSNFFFFHGKMPLLLLLLCSLLKCGAYVCTVWVCVCVCSTMYVCMQHLNMCTHPACVFKYETHTHKKGGPIISHKIIHEMRYARRRRRRRWAQELQTEIIKGALLLAAAKNYKSVLPPSFTFFLWLAVLC